MRPLAASRLTLHCSVSRGGKLALFLLSIHTCPSHPSLACNNRAAHVGHVSWETCQHDMWASWSLTALAPGIEDVELHSKAISGCSLPAKAVLQLRFHPNAALGQHSEHPPDLHGVPTLPQGQECIVWGARLSLPSLLSTLQTW